MSFFKQEAFRDEKWLIELRSHADIFTGYQGNDSDPIEALHIGTLGRSKKSPDNETLPVRHSKHAWGHQHGEMTMFRQNMPDWMLREALRLFAIDYHHTHTGLIVPKYERKQERTA
jgi:hypothetical protein